MSTQNEAAKEFALENVITTAVQIPGVKVNRKQFLAEVFAKEDYSIDQIVETDPIQVVLILFLNKLIRVKT